MTLRYYRTLAYGGPVFIVALEALARSCLGFEELSHFYSEKGYFEVPQVIIGILAVICAISILPKLSNIWLKVWIGMAVLGCIYIVGEELSWGQWVFEWDTPENWSAINDQNETNLHNTSTWLDQKPRALMEVGILVGGLIVPALRKWNPDKLPKKFASIYPGNMVVLTALFAFSVKLINFSGDIFGNHVFYRGSEIMEFLIYYFILLYLVDFKARLPERN